MERKRKLQYLFLTLLTALHSCAGIQLKEECDVRITFGTSALMTKAEMPDEERISDISLMIFDDNGMLERHVRLENTGNEPYATVSLLNGMRYTVCACVNFGYDVNVSDIRELEEVCFYLAYPDEYREGLPMYAYQETIVTSQTREIRLELIRLMSKISIRMDRSLLSDDVRMDVSGIRIGNCPKKVRVFTESRVNSEDDCFRVGFSHDDYESSPLNRIKGNGTSEELSLYMLENMQGRFSDTGITSDSDKVFGPLDPRQHTCSYIEMELDYRSSGLHSTSPLIYRFYLGEDRNSLDIERNCHYHITVCPEDSGLSGNGWRVDKSGIETNSAPSLTPLPSQYIRGDIGERIHIWCETTPADAPFDVGKDYMEDDKAKGIYDYEIDADGHGAVLTLTGPGTGLIYMEAGDPINDAALFIIEVNLP